MRAVTRCGAGHVLITNGGDGSYVASTDIRHCQVLPTEIAGTAGAGDAFAATFAALLVKTGDISTAQRAATYNASSVIGFADTQSGLLELKDVEKFLASPPTELRTTAWAF